MAILTYPLRRARDFGQRAARTNARAGIYEAASRRVLREETRADLEGQLHSPERDERNRQIQQFLDERLAGIPHQRSTTTEVDL
jgi:hypothetical protein